MKVLFSHKKILALIVVACALVLIPAAQALAREPKTTLLVSPAITEWVSTSGQTQTRVVQLYNQTDDHVPIRAVAQAFAFQHEEANISQKQRFDASKWMSIEEPDFILKPREVRNVTIRLSIPKDAPPGGHYATVYFQQLAPVDSLSKPEAKVVGRVSMLAFIIVGGTIEKKVTLAEPVQVRWAKGSLWMDVKLRNEGNVHVLPQGDVIINNFFGKKKASLPLPIGVLLPGTTRTYSVTWPEPGFYGLYSAKVQATYGEKHDAIAETASRFWVLPSIWVLLLPIFVFAGWFFGYRIRGRWQRAWRVLVNKKRI